MAPSDFTDLDWFSRSVGIPPERLSEAFELEREFHKRILSEPDREVRKRLYREIYRAVHPLYAKNSTCIDPTANPKDRMVRTFRRELEGRSILEVGCGQGGFLESVARQVPHKELVGIDISINPYSRVLPAIQFIEADIVEFSVSTKFDVVFSDQVMEHIAPADLPWHLSSVRDALKPGGVFIVMMPNRLFGPSDVTRILDFSYSGRVAAQGTHINESTYEECMGSLRTAGFTEFKTILPKGSYLFPNMRISPEPLRLLESSSLLLSVLRSVRRGGQCLVQLPVNLICRTPR